jgi:hypothetical protein
MAIIGNIPYFQTNPNLEGNRFSNGCLGASFGVYPSLMMFNGVEWNDGALLGYAPDELVQCIRVWKLMKLIGTLGTEETRVFGKWMNSVSETGRKNFWAIIYNHIMSYPPNGLRKISNKWITNSAWASFRLYFPQ